MANITKGYTFGATEEVTAAKLHSLIDSATVTNISTADIGDGTVTNDKIMSVAGSKITSLTDLPASVKSDFFKLIYPIGCIYTSTSSTNPATVFGFGTWTAFGAGKVLVGLDSGDADFDTSEETGGSKTHSHDAGSLLTQKITSFTTRGGAAPTFSTGSAYAIDDATGGTDYDGYNADNVTIDGSTATTSNVPPYIVVYFFKRTA